MLEVKLKTSAAHAASLPVALIPNCAATRHVHFSLDGSGPARFTPPDLTDWPGLAGDPAATLRRVDTLRSAKHCSFRASPHQPRCRTPPADRNVARGPVDAVGDEVIGPAGPTTSTRMDRCLSTVLPATGLRVMIGKAERGSAAI